MCYNAIMSCGQRGVGVAGVTMLSKRIAHSFRYRQIHSMDRYQKEKRYLRFQVYLFLKFDFHGQIQWPPDNRDDFVGHTS